MHYERIAASAAAVAETSSARAKIQKYYTVRKLRKAESWDIADIQPAVTSEDIEP